MLIIGALPPTRCSSTRLRQALPEAEQQEDLPPGAIRRMTSPTTAVFLQSGYDINNLFTLNGGVRYQYTENKIDDFIGYAQRRIAAGKAIADAFWRLGRLRQLFNAGLLMHITERQQAWLNFSRGVELPDPGKYYGRGIYGACSERPSSSNKECERQRQQAGR